MSKFNEVLRSLRNSAQLSQQELANDLKISKSSVNMYERGEREPGLETLEKIADFFNVSMDYLLGRKMHLKNPNRWKNKGNSYRKGTYAESCCNLRTF